MTNGLTKHATEFRENGLPQHGLTEHVEDPVIRMKRRKLEAIERMSMRFKLIDIQFLQMVKDDGGDVPTFAVVLYESFKRKVACSFDGARHLYTSENIDIPGPRNVVGTHYATPEHDVPDSVDAMVNEVRNDFDRVCVAWDAKWATAAGGDPLVIGEIDGVWFLIAKWDTTAVESYIAG